MPYNHSNVMSDEVIYYASSEFMSRKSIEYGSVTLHPDGIPHGPHPGRTEAVDRGEGNQRARGDGGHIQTVSRQPAGRGDRGQRGPPLVALVNGGLRVVDCGLCKVVRPPACRHNSVMFISSVDNGVPNLYRNPQSAIRNHRCPSTRRTIHICVAGSNRRIARAPTFQFRIFRWGCFAARSPLNRHASGHRDRRRHSRSPAMSSCRAARR